MADALVLLVTASIFLSGFLSVRIHQDLDRATDATGELDRSVRQWSTGFRDIDTDNAVTPFIELVSGLRPDPVVRSTAVANTVFAACVAVLATYWVIHPVTNGDSDAARWAVGGVAVLVQVVVVALFEYDRRRVARDFRNQLSGACNAIVYHAPYVFAPHSVQIATTDKLRGSILEAIESIECTAQYDYPSKFAFGASTQTAQISRELALVHRWLKLLALAEEPSAGSRFEQHGGEADADDPNLRVAEHLLNASEAKFGTSGHDDVDVNFHLLTAAREHRDGDDRVSGVASDALWWALIKENSDSWESAHYSIGVFIGTGEVTGAERAAAGIDRILGEYLAGRRSKAEAEHQLGKIRDPRTDAVAKRYATLPGALRMWVKLEMRLGVEEHDSARRARALLLAEELRLKDPAAGDVDVDRELRLLGAYDDAHIAERMWLHLVRGQVQEAAAAAAEMRRNPMESVLTDQPLMTLAWAWIFFQSGEVENAAQLLRKFSSSPHAMGIDGRRDHALERVWAVVTQNGVSSQRFRVFADMVNKSCLDKRSPLAADVAPVPQP